MIIFGGTKAKQTVLDSGHFLCPACESEQRYLHKSVQKKAHVFFISLASIGDALEYVECQTCKSTLHPQVLNVGTDPSFGAAEDALLDIVAWTIVADDKINDSERKVAAEQYQKIVDTRIDEAELQARIDSVLQTGTERVLRSLAGHGRTLDLGTRIMLFKAALLVADADDDIASEELQAVVYISNALDLSEAQMKTTMEEMIAAQGG